MIPPKIQDNQDALDLYLETMQIIQDAYDGLRELKIPTEDARFVLPNAAAVNLNYDCKSTCIT